MKKFGIRVLGIFAAGLIVTFIGTEARTGQQRIELIKAIDNSTSMSRLESQAVREACQKAVFQKALQLLPFSLPKQRKKNLRSYLGDKSQDFVLTYSLDTRHKDSERAEFIFYVSVNEKALKKRLKNLGTYFTAKDKVKYSLQAGGFSSDIWQRILRLENLSGLERGDVRSPLLRLRYDQDNKRWLGIIRVGDKSWSGRAISLPDLWEEIWAFYFMLPQTQSRFLETIFVRIDYWSTVTGLQTFDKDLNSWSSVLEEVTLKHLNISTKGIQGQWKMKTMSVPGLKRHLKESLKNRELELSYSMDPFE